MIRIAKEQLKKITPEILIAAIAFLAGIAMAWYVYTQHLMVTLSDQAAHLVFARLLTDSLTPGVSQLGTWPPLLHILMMPAAAIRPLFETGLAGAITLIPIFVAGAVLLYRLAYILTQDKLLSFVAALIYIFNPYVLYYTVTPMMEVLFITMVIAVAYYFVLWLEYSRVQHLLLAGIFVTLASISRYEGLFLLPAVFLIVFINLIYKRARYREIEATIIIFGLLATLGFGYLVLYGWIFVGHPLAFAGVGGGTGWFMGGDAALSITKGNFLEALRYAMHASYYMFSKIMVLASFVGFIISSVLLRNRFKVLTAIFLLLIPFLAILFALYRGSNSIHVPELAPFDRFHNDRYMLSWVGVVALAPILVASYFKQIQLRLVSVFIAMLALFFSGHHLYDSVIQKDFFVIKNNISANQHADVNDFINGLRTNYESGKILVVRFNNDFLYIDSKISLKQFIYEGNWKYFDQTLDRPWLYTRMVIMQNPQSIDVADFRDPVKDKWGNNFEFQKYYSLVFEEKDRIIYVLNEQAVIKYAEDHGLNTSKIPSLNSSIVEWNPDTIEKEMSITGVEK